jgi:transposase
MITLSPHQRYFVFRGAADMRKGFDGLCGMVRDHLQCDPLSGDVFVFFNRSRSHVKILWWDRDGFAIYYKRLERGTFEVPAADQDLQITAQTLSLILDGIVLSSVKKKKRFHFAA